LADWPDYVRDCIRVDDGVSLIYPRAVDDFVYLYGSTCENEVGLTMTLAHELQHAVQHNNVRRLWAVNGIVTRLHKRVIAALNLRWADIPIERESRIVSKRVAVHFFGEQHVTNYIDEKIAEGVIRSDVADVADWQVVRTLESSDSVVLQGDTQKLFERLTNYRPELEVALQRMKKYNPEDFGDIDLEPYFAVPT
jgi:hypothetical protein